MSEITLGTDVETGQPVCFGEEARRRGLYLLGSNGTGKSTLVHNMIQRDFVAGHGFCLIDPHGDLVDDIRRTLPAGRAVHVIALADTRAAAGFNPFYCPDPSDEIALSRTVARSVAVFKKIWGPGSAEPSWGPRMENLLRVSAYTLAYTGQTMVELPRLLIDDAWRRRVIVHLPPRSNAALFWRSEWPSRVEDQRDYRDSTMNKVMAFLDDPRVLRVVGQRESCVDFRLAMDKGRGILVKLAVGQLGDGPASLVGSLIMGLITEATLGRGDTRERPLFCLYCDEFQRFATPDFATLLSEGRKYGVATTIAHQYLGQLEDGIRGAVLQVPNKVVFQISGQDATSMAREFSPPEEEPLITGSQPMRVPTPHAVEELLRRGHVPAAEELVKNLDFQQLMDYVERKNAYIDETLDRASAGEYVRLGRDWHGIHASRSKMQEGLRLVDEYLLGRMRGNLSIEEQVDFLTRITVSLCGFIGFHTQGRRRDRTPYPLNDSRRYRPEMNLSRIEPVSLSPEIRRLLPEIVQSGITHWPVHSDNGRMVKGSMFVACARWNKEVVEQLTSEGKDIVTELENYLASRLEMEKTIEKNLPSGQWLYDLTHKEPLRSLDLAKEVFVLLLREYGRGRIEEIYDGFISLGQFLNDLDVLGDILAKEPILIDSGQYTPVYERPRPIMDRSAELARRLSSLPRYTAMVKIAGDDEFEQHEIRPEPPPKLAEPVGEAFLLGRAAAEVDAEIDIRRSDDDGPARRRTLR